MKFIETNQGTFVKKGRKLYRLFTLNDGSSYLLEVKVVPLTKEQANGQAQS